MIKQTKRFFVIVLLLTTGLLHAQSVSFLPGTRTYEINDRLDVLYWKNFDLYFSAFGNVQRGEAMKKAGSLYNLNDLTLLDLQDISYLRIEHNEDQFNSLFQVSKKSDVKKYSEDGVFYSMEGEEGTVTPVETPEGPSFFNTFYKSPAHFFEVNNNNFTLRANPVLDLRYGSASDDDNIVFKNLRGVEIRGSIDDRFYFYTNIHETQARFNNYIEDRINKYKAIPGQGFYKTYNSGVIDNLKGWDYLNSQGYIGANLSKSIALELGHGKHHIGNGIRSLLLSDYGNNYLYLKLNTQVWRLRYQNLFAELNPISSKLNSGDRLLPKKYIANHTLSYKPFRNMEISLFETVVFSRENQFEFQYLNPIILYRTVEQLIDSPDNVLIGMNGSWNITPGVQLYGQLVLDEFKLNEITSGTGWWANKYGLQAGVKYYNVANIDHLDVQLEANWVRPYTYAHRDTLEAFPAQNVASYTHYNQPLAHPLGANFKEIVAEVRYRPIDKLFLKGRMVKTSYGQDFDGLNYGGNPLLPQETRVADYGNETGQGLATDLTMLHLTASYSLYHNVFFDLEYLYRNADATGTDRDVKTSYIGAAFRMNISKVDWDY